MNNQLQRQSLGCGYEPASKRAVMLWSPPTGKVGYGGPKATVCPGYTTSLPEVLETVLLRRHWENGCVAAACDERPTDETLSMILRLDNAFGEVKRWASTPASDGGGGA